MKSPLLILCNCAAFVGAVSVLPLWIAGDLDWAMKAFSLLIVGGLGSIILSK